MILDLTKVILVVGKLVLVLGKVILILDQSGYDSLIIDYHSLKSDSHYGPK